MAHNSPAFVGREWLRDEVVRFQNDSERHHLIIVGEPGSGKSAFITYLSDLWGCPHYFMRAGNLDTAAGASARAFLLSIGGQLADKYGSDIFGQSSDSIIVQVGVTTDGSQIVGRDIDRRYTLPFLAGRSQGSVTVRAGLTKGSRITGQKVREWYDFSTAVDESTLLHSCILEPLCQLARRDPQHCVLILVDALDEAAHRPSPTILNVIPRTDDPQFPTNLKLLMTSRPGEHLLVFHPEDQLRLSEHKLENLSDTRLYIETRFKEEPLETFVGRLPEAERDNLIERIEDRSAGNFLYLFHFLNAASAAVAAGRSLDELPIPQGLDEIYRFFAINEIKSDADLKTWQGAYLPLLKTFAIIREPVSKKLLAAFAQVDLSAVDFVVARLSQFLTTIEDEEGVRFAFYHMDFAEYLLDTGRNKDFTLDPAEIHKHIADFFCGTSGRPVNLESEWVPRDYAFNNLPYHVLHGYGFERLDSLVARGNDKIEWAEAHYKHFSSYVRYLDGVSFAASAALDAPLAHAYAQHYALIASSIRSLSNRLHPAMLELLAATGEWTWAAVLEHIQQLPDWSQLNTLEKLISSVPFEYMHDALIAIDHLPDKTDVTRLFELMAKHWPQPWPTGVGQLAIEVVDHIADKQARSYILAVLSTVLPKQLRLTATHKALEAVASEKRASIATTLFERVLSRLASDVMEEAFAAATGIEDDWARAKALATLSSHLGPERQDELRKQILGIKGEWARAEGIAQLLIRTPPEKRGVLPFRGLLLTRKFRNEYDRIRAITKFLPFLPPWLANYLALRAMGKAVLTPEPKYRVTVLIGLLPDLSPARKTAAGNQALATIQQLPNPSDRLTALNTLVSIAPETVNLQAANDALEIVAGLRDTSEQHYQLSKIIPLAPAAALIGVLEILEGIRDSSKQQSLFVLLAPRLPEDLLERAQALVLQAQEIDRPQMLAALATHPSAECRRWVYESAVSIKNEYWRASALAAIAPIMKENHPDILASVRHLEDSYARANALVSLIGILSPEAATALIPEALSAAKAIPYLDARAERLAEIATHLPIHEQRPIVLEALASCKVIGDLNNVVTECINFFLRLPGSIQIDLFNDILNMTMRQSSKWERSGALRKIIDGFGPSAPEEALRTLLETALSLGPPHNQPCLYALCDHLTGDLVQKCYDGSRELDAYARAEILGRLSRKLVGEDREKAVQIVIEQAKVPRWISAANLMDLPQEVLTVETGRWTRIVELAGDPKDLTQTYPLNRFQVLWRELAERIPQPLIAKALDAAKRLANSRLRLEVLCKLAAHMDLTSATTMVKEGLATLRSCIDQLDSQKLLIDLAAFIPEGQLENLFVAAQWIKDDYPRAQTLVKLARTAKGASNPVLARLAFESAAAVSNEGWRASTIAELAPVMPEDLLSPALNLVLAMHSHDPKTFALSSLAARAPNLEGLPSISRLLADAHQVSHQVWQAETLINVAGILNPPVRVNTLRLALLQTARLPSWNREPLFGRAVSIWASAGFADGQITASRTLADVINNIRGETRNVLLASITPLAPALAHVGGLDGARQILQSVVCVERWWL